jgi:hypothetical protein
VNDESLQVGRVQDEPAFRIDGSGAVLFVKLVAVVTLKELKTQNEGT